MPIDEKIEEASEEIDKVISKWGFSSNYGNKYEKRITVERWFRNFQPSEFDDALLILKRIKYYDSDTVTAYIGDLSKELSKMFDGDFSNVLFYPLGDSPASSGGNFLYTSVKNWGYLRALFRILHSKILI